MFAYFVLANEDEIAQAYSLDQVFNLIERTDPMVGGGISLEALGSLSKLFGGQDAPAETTIYALNDGSRFYELNADFCSNVASSTHEELLDKGALWAKQPPWIMTDINRMDLAGFMLELAALCRQTKPGAKTIYLLVSE